MKGENLVNGESKEEAEGIYLYSGSGKKVSSNGAAMMTRYAVQQLHRQQPTGATIRFPFVFRLQNNDFLIGRWSRDMSARGIILTSWLTGQPSNQGRLLL